MFRLPDNLLNLSAEEAARRIALAQLAAAQDAYLRLEDGSDAEALHDFRVAIRRTRSTLGVYRQQLRGKRLRKLGQKLRGLQQATNDGRDAEVQIQWLEDHAPSLTPSALHGHQWLLERLRKVRDRAHRKTSGVLKQQFVKVTKEACAALGRLRVDLCAEQRPVLAQVVAELVEQRADRLRRLLGRIEGADDAETAHKARIAGKQLRYLLEPFAADLIAVDDCVKRLKGLQDVLGRLHDNQVMAEVVGEAHAQAAVDHARRSHKQAMSEREPQRRSTTGSEQPGLLVLARQLAVEREELFGELELDWLGDAGLQLLADISALSGLLRTSAMGPVEIERKYLLASLPERTQSASSVEIEQGWLPGERLMERVRRVVGGGRDGRDGSDGRDTYLRTVKVGRGVRRIEIEEETTAEVFHALWPLTAGKRVHKRRYVVEAGELTWEIDNFADRDLVLAEIELPTVDTPVSFPDWLDPFVVREVTDESEYCNINLAITS